MSDTITQSDSDDKLGGSHGDCGMLSSCAGQYYGAWNGQEKDAGLSKGY